MSVLLYSDDTWGCLQKHIKSGAYAAVASVIMRQTWIQIWNKIIAMPHDSAGPSCLTIGCNLLNAVRLCNFVSSPAVAFESVGPKTPTGWAVLMPLNVAATTSLSCHLVCPTLFA